MSLSYPRWKVPQRKRVTLLSSADIKEDSARWCLSAGVNPRFVYVRRRHSLGDVKVVLRRRDKGMVKSPAPIRVATASSESGSYPRTLHLVPGALYYPHRFHTASRSTLEAEQPTLSFNRHLSKLGPRYRQPV